MIPPHTYDEKRSGHFQSRRLAWLQQRLSDHFLEDEPRRLVEIGTGTGGLISKLATRYARWSFCGLDINSPYLTFADQTNRAANCLFVKADCQVALPLFRVDGLFSFDVLHHLSDLRSVIRAVHSSLNPGGIWLAVEPNMLNPYICGFQAFVAGESNFVTWTSERLFKKHFEIAEKSYFFLIPSAIRQPPSIAVRLESVLESTPFLAGAVGYVLERR